MHNIIRGSGFKGSEIFQNYDNHPQVEVVRNPKEWVYVGSLMPPITVPMPTKKPDYNSLWKPPVEGIEKKYPYTIYRNKNHMLPIYLRKTYRGLRQVTILKRIDGDIWQLEKHLKSYIENSIGKKILTRVNEMTGQIHFRGEFVILLHEYLLKKGF